MTEDGRMVDSCIKKRDGLVDIGQWTEEDIVQWTEGVETLVPSAPLRDLLSDDSDVS